MLNIENMIINMTSTTISFLFNVYVENCQHLIGFWWIMNIQIDRQRYIHILIIKIALNLTQKHISKCGICTVYILHIHQKQLQS